MAFLEVNQVKKSFGQGDTRVEVLRGIDLTVEKGKLCVLLGPSGSGKSTLLNIIGGHSCMMDFLNTKIMKDMKNNINRVVNCENANLSKIVDASLEQREAVRFLREKGLFSLLPPTLAEIAVVREENPDASIAELGKLLSPPLSKSGVNHRLTKLMKFAEQYMK